MKGFGSDNHSGVHPEILQALVAANVDHAPSYGTDDWTERAQEKFRQLFAAPKAQVFFVFNGTGANVICARAMLRPWQSMLVSDVSHMHLDECGAPEAVGGMKLIPVASQNGKVSVSELKKWKIRGGDQHFSQVRAVSLTQPTEYGTCYSPDELEEIATWCKQEKLFLHIDGARIANSVVFTGLSFAELYTHRADIISFGGTKNGLLFGEAVVVLNPDLCPELSYIRKQSMQLPSKTRFVAAQMECYLSQNLWHLIASHSMKVAQELFEGVQGIPGVTVTQPRQSNAVFAKIPKNWLSALRKKHFFYVWDEATWECRWMTSWDTTSSEIQEFIQSLREQKL